MNKEPIYIMTLELEKGNSKQIKIFSDSDANKITKDFCNENKIDLNSKKKLKKQIEDLIKQFKNENNKNKIIHKPFLFNNINKIEENKNPEFNNINSEKFKSNSNNKKNKYFSKSLISNKEIIEKTLKKNNNSNSNKNFIKLNEPIRNKKINHSKSSSNPSILLKSSSNHINIKNKNIFERLYKEGTLKRIFQCHSNSNEKNTKNNNIFTYENDKNKKKNKIILDENGKKINYGEYLYKREILNSKEKNKNNQKLKENEIKEKMKECSFNPKINNYNNNNNNNTNNNNKYKTKRKNNILNNDLIFTFKPKINKNYKSNLNFCERLNYFNTLYKEKKNNLNKIYNNFNYLNEKKKKTITNDDNHENVFEKNYQYAEKYNKNKELLKNKYNYNHLNNYKNISRNNNNSNSILNNFVDNLGSKIFKILDKDEDNLISAININLKIDKDILNIINPLIIEIKDENFYLNENEFVLAFRNLYKFLDFKEKNILQKFFYEKKNDNNILNNTHDNKFYINKNTEKLANNHDEMIEKKYFNKEKNTINRNQYFNKINNDEKNKIESENNENIHKFTFEINTKNNIY